jgi:hypothetical protein
MKATAAFIDETPLRNSHAARQFASFKRDFPERRAIVRGQRAWCGVLANQADQGDPGCSRIG